MKKIIILFVEFLKNINFKQGFRRMVIVLIGLFVLISFCFVESEVDSIFTEKCFIKFERDTELEFFNTYIKKGEYTFTQYGEEIGQVLVPYCNAYKRICKIENYDYKDNDGTKAKLIMPKTSSVFLWTFLMVVKRILFGLLAYLTYILLEISFVWVVSGFKRK